VPGVAGPLSRPNNSVARISLDSSVAPRDDLRRILAGWINEHQQAAIEYLREKNRVLKKQLGGMVRFYHRVVA
jgi:hypothetical protein